MIVSFRSLTKRKKNKGMSHDGTSRLLRTVAAVSLLIGFVICTYGMLNDNVSLAIGGALGGILVASVMWYLSTGKPATDDDGVCADVDFSVRRQACKCGNVADVCVCLNESSGVRLTEEA